MGYNAAVFFNLPNDDTPGAEKLPLAEEHMESLTDISNSGANAVRIVAKAGGSWWNSSPQVQENLVERAITLGLVPILEMHEDECDQPVPAATRSHWESPEMIQLAQEEEERLWINLANRGDFLSLEIWRDHYVDMIRSLRERQVRNLVVVTTSGDCGQDPAPIVRYAADILQADPQKNVVFAIHIYEDWSTELIRPNLYMLRDTGVALFIAGFGWDVPANTMVQYNPRVLVEEAATLGIGWTFWAWYEDTPYLRAVTSLVDPTKRSAAGDFLMPSRRTTRIDDSLIGIQGGGAGALLLEVAACGVCRTDPHILDGELEQPALPLILGHQVVGRVRALGPCRISFQGQVNRCRVRGVNSAFAWGCGGKSVCL